MTPDFRRHLGYLPNLVSLGRIGLILVATVLLMTGWPLLGLIIGIIGGISDYLDGYLARKRGETTDLGALLDSLADILFSLVCLTVSVMYRIWPAYLLVAWGFRDMTIMTLRGSAGLQGFMIKSSFLAKLAWNFNAYAFVLMGLDIARPFSSEMITNGVHWLGLFGIHAGILMQWISGGQYLASYAAQYREKKPD